jgi:hypothetical protein
MMRNLKAFGLALVAIGALSASVAAAASANQFHSTATNTTITVASNATQQFQYEEFGEIVTCTSVKGEGKISAQTTAEVTFAPVYSGCELLFVSFSTVQVNMNGCDYLFTVNASSNSGPVHIQCPKEKQITMTVKVFGVSICTYHIAPQTPSGESDYANFGASNVQVTGTQWSIEATRQGSSECGAASSTQGRYSGEAIVKGEETGTQNEKAIQVG